MKIAFSDLDHADYLIESDILSSAGLSATMLRCRSEMEVIEQLNDVDIVLNQYAPFTRRVFEALPRLKQVVRYGVGVNNIDIAAATQAGVQVCHVPDYGMHEVSDHALALTLALLRKLVPMHHACHQGRWDYVEAVPLRRLSLLTIGVTGLGRIGRLYARKMQALGCHVLGYDAYYHPCAEDGTEMIQRAELLELYSDADVIAVFCPLTADTHHLINASALSSMKEGVYLINTSRGGIIDEDALADALASGQVAGAGIDTTEHEPLQPSSRLWSSPHCLITPHMAWYSEDAAAELKRKVAEEAVRFARGEPVLWPVNRLTS
ncbi:MULTISPECIES: C-terminal binding protein [Halomonas]|uniref:C-terminal binding protein n=1 Tax=Halomonas TaxID=2745 RepID=UPI001C967A2A|nr:MULTISPECIES: C-terminal binding protein [Halomonas]MBY6206652.1 C-terminal binding protein [Halomonas sp. DP3Y7-2]MBY6230183.1 C-terminal binding protein [Halomonas sp. DP3Y7-1]MCA0918313.1 C-terminal binding protein [Halomonas denitrificans]